VKIASGFPSAVRRKKAATALFAAAVLLIAFYLPVESALAQGPRQIYSDTADPHADIAQALKTALREHKRVIVDFGGNWCGDCQVLDIYFHQQPNLSLLEKNFVLVHVNIGHYDKNNDVIEKYGIPIHNGVPLLMVLNAHGQVLLIQKHKEFEKMQIVTPQSVMEFLNQWKPKG
jgi:thiol:disulfide interchange protein